MFFRRKEKEEPRKLIEFSCSPYDDAYPHPVPAHKVVPKWWQNLSRHVDPPQPNMSHGLGLVDGADIPPVESVKACVPVLDTLRTGYIIPLWTELIIGYDDPSGGDSGEPLIAWNYQGLGPRDLSKTANLQAIERRHLDPKSFETAKGMPIYNRALEIQLPYMWTFNSPWTIKTPPGYSCLFTKPLNSDLPFDFINGIVNTDKYHLSVNWNFMMNRRFRGTLRVGTPMMQVIPFKRDEWESEVRSWNEEDIKQANISLTGLDMYFEGGYQRMAGCPINHS